MKIENYFDVAAKLLKTLEEEKGTIGIDAKDPSKIMAYRIAVMNEFIMLNLVSVARNVRESADFEECEDHINHLKNSFYHMVYLINSQVAKAFDLVFEEKKQKIIKKNY